MEHFSLVLIILATLVPTFAIRHQARYDEELEQRRNSYCNNSDYGGIYIFEDDLRCCKERALRFEDVDINDCSAEVGKQNPDDDVATYLWKVEACRYKNALNLQEDTLEFKTLVDFITKDYTNYSNIKGWIKDKIKECPDEDKETLFYKKFQAFYLCFYKNEQKICEDPSPTGIEAKTKILGTFNNTSTCNPFPGAWDQPSFCCKGKTTPKQWKYESLNPYSHWDEAWNEGTSDCRYNLEDLYPHQPNYNMTVWEEYDYHSMFECFDSCVRNPIMFQNGSNTAPEVVFDFNKTLETYAERSSLPANVKEDLKSIVWRHKSSFKMAFKAVDFENENGITFDDIEAQYPSLSEQRMQVKYYCNYYRNIRLLFEVAIAEHCDSEEAFNEYLREKTRRGR